MSYEQETMDKSKKVEDYWIQDAPGPFFILSFSYIVSIILQSSQTRS